MTEKICVLVKPDGVNRKLTRNVIDEYLEAGFKLQDQKHFEAGNSKLLDIFKVHYEEHRSKDFYEDLVAEMAVGPVEAVYFTRSLYVEHPSARDVMMRLRTWHGKTVRHNTLHCSDSSESAARELKLWGF